ncbi:O-antigen acetylase [Caldimonas brevitalea]|uniref:O-antigen acetylase n=1 Tax=Caldimonas brevitalea TaxID=413882 RepID=A0A0G3BF43_9BURK|nr:O-antigen acetylase [Caldimonas brevitalea]
MNLARWLAALCVMVSHLRDRLFGAYGELSDPNPLWTAFYFVTGYGHEAVVVFFVISGFLVGGITWQRWSTQGPDVPRYMAARFARVYTVVVPAIALGLMLDLLGARFFNASTIYPPPEPFGVETLANVRNTDWITVLGNVFMLQEIVVETPGTNGVLWSMSYEWWYYVLFGLLGAAAAMPRQRSALGYGVLGLAVAAFLPPGILMMGLLWMIGVGACQAYRAGWRVPALLALPAFGAVLVVLRVLTIKHDFGLSLDLVKKLTLSLSFAALLLVNWRPSGTRISHLHKVLADSSFSLYMTHSPMIVFLAAVANDTFGLQYHRSGDAVGLLLFVLFTAVVYAYSFVFWRLFERHHGKVFKWLTSWPRVAGKPA